MTDTIAGFFHDLGRRGHVPLLEKGMGAIRFDLFDGGRTDRWFVTLEKGDVSVSRKKVAADCVVRADRRVFEAVVSGDANGMAAYLRGELIVEGDPELLVLFQRVLPGSPTIDSQPAGTSTGSEQG